MREKLHYAANNSSPQEPMKSTREANCIRLVSAGLVPSSRTLTRTLFLDIQGLCMGPAIFRQRYKPQTRQALPDDERAKKERNERILRHRPALSLDSFLPKNQGELSAHFCTGDYHGAHRNTRIVASTPSTVPLGIILRGNQNRAYRRNDTRGEGLAARNRKQGASALDTLPDVLPHLDDCSILVLSVRETVRVA